MSFVEQMLEINREEIREKMNNVIDPQRTNSYQLLKTGIIILSY